MSSVSQTDGALRVVFATISLGMGVDFKSLHYIIHYGAPWTTFRRVALLAELPPIVILYHPFSLHIPLALSFLHYTLTLPLALHRAAK